MKISGFLLCSFFCLCVGTFAQKAPPPAPAPAPAPKPQPAPVPATPPAQPQSTVLMPGGNRSTRLDPLFPYDPFRNLDATPSLSESEMTSLRLSVLHKYADPLYRKPTKDELESVKPSPALFERYRAILEREDAGLFKLVPDAGCAENSKVVTASEVCMKFTFPGAGNSYSFRVKNYRIRQLADLTFSGSDLVITGSLTHGIFVDLGDVPINEVSLQTAGLKYLIDFQPSAGFKEANTVNESLIKGIKQNGFLYTRSLPVIENNTYALRSIAYRGRVMTSIKGVPYNELDFDRRRDIVVVFRIVQKDADGSISILWNQLSDKEAPKIKPRHNDDKDKDESLN